VVSWIAYSEWPHWLSWKTDASIINLTSIHVRWSEIVVKSGNLCVNELYLHRGVSMSITIVINFNLAVSATWFQLSLRWRTSPHHHYHSLCRRRLFPCDPYWSMRRIVSGTKRRLGTSRYVDDRKIAGDALGWSSLLMQSARCIGRSIDHSTMVICLVCTVRGFTAFFQTCNFFSSARRIDYECASIITANEKGTSLFFLLFLYSCRSTIGLYKSFPFTVASSVRPRRVKFFR